MAPPRYTNSQVWVYSGPAALTSSFGVHTTSVFFPDTVGPNYLRTCTMAVIILTRSCDDRSSRNDAGIFSVEHAPDRPYDFHKWIIHMYYNIRSNNIVYTYKQMLAPTVNGRYSARETSRPERGEGKKSSNHAITTFSQPLQKCEDSTVSLANVSDCTLRAEGASQDTTNYNNTDYIGHSTSPPQCPRRR